MLLMRDGYEWRLFERRRRKRGNGRLAEMRRRNYRLCWHGLRRRVIEMRYLWSNVLISKLEQGRIDVVFVLHTYTVGTILNKFFSSISFRFASNSSTSQFTLSIINHNFQRDLRSPSI